MIRYRNTDERYGSDSGVFEAESLDAVVAAMEPMFAEWAADHWQEHVEACRETGDEPGDREAFISDDLETMRDECREGLEIVKDTPEYLATLAVGLRYDSPEAKAILDRADWSGVWPVVDADGDLTGKISEGDDAEYALVDDLALVLIADLPESQQQEIQRERNSGTWSGYVTLPISA